MKYINLIILVMVLLFTGLSYAQLPANIAAPMITKIIPFEQNTVSKDIVIYVVGNNDIAYNMKKYEVQTIGGAKITKIESGNDVPKGKVTVIYVDSDKNFDNILKYCNSNKILCITGNVALVAKGAAVCIGTEGGKPKITINASASTLCGLNWQPAIFKIATKI